MPEAAREGMYSAIAARLPVGRVGQRQVSPRLCFRARCGNLHRPFTLRLAAVAILAAMRVGESF